MRCENKNCPNQADQGSKFCRFHQVPPVAALPAKDSMALADGIYMVDIASIPSGRSNPVAMDILATLKGIPEGKGLKLKALKFSKSTLLATQRYALTTGLRIGVRFVGEWNWVWKMTPEQVKAAEVKADRISKARQKIHRKAS